MDKIFKFLLILIPVTLVAEFLHVSPVIIFFLAAGSIIPLAKYLGEATEELSTRTSAALGGILNATFGNATEFIIGIFALRTGLIEVVKASLTGSILGNLLLVLGMAMLAGGAYHKKQKFNRTAILASGTTLLLSVIALVIPAIFLLTSPKSGSQIIEELSVFVSIFMIIGYVATLWFALRTHKHLYTSEVGRHEPQWSLGKSLWILGLATAAVAVMSEILVGSIEPLVTRFGWTELFVGVIFVAIIGNAAEHTSAILMAVKNRMDLALQISIGSATQIAMFVAPLLVFISLIFGKPMSLVFNSFELISIVLAVLIVNLVIEDGESNWLEGLQLIMAYAIIAVGFFFFR